MLGDSRADREFPLRHSGGKSMSLEGRTKSITVLRVSQLGKGCGSLPRGLRPDHGMHVLEEDERAERVVSLAE